MTTQPLIQLPRRRGRSALPGRLRPSALSVLRVSTSSNLIGCVTGSQRQNALPIRVPLSYSRIKSKRILGGGRPNCFRLAASSCHVSPRAASRSLMWPSARLRRSANVPGLSSADTQKSLKSCRTASRRRSISCWYLPPNGGSVQPPKKSTGYRLANLNHPKQPAHAGRN